MYILWSLEPLRHVTPLVLMGAVYNPLYERTALEVRLCYEILEARYEASTEQRKKHIVSCKSRKALNYMTGQSTSGLKQGWEIQWNPPDQQIKVSPHL